MVGNADRTAGTVILRARVGGAAQSGVALGTIDATNVRSASNFVAAGSGVAVTAGQKVGAALQSTSLSPTTVEYQGWLVFEYTP